MQERCAEGLLIQRRLLASDSCELLCVLTQQFGVVTGITPLQQHHRWPAGTVLNITHTVRSPTQLGRIDAQMLRPYAAQALIYGRCAVAGIQLVCDTLARYMPDDAAIDASLYAKTIALVAGHASNVAHITHIHALWEKLLLRHLGYAHHTDSCYSVACPQEPVYLSPRTARGACITHGHLWKERLLQYPRLWRAPCAHPHALHEWERVLPVVWKLVPAVRTVNPQYSRLQYIQAWDAAPNSPKTALEHTP